VARNGQTLPICSLTKFGWPNKLILNSTNSMDLSWESWVKKEINHSRSSEKSDFLLREVRWGYKLLICVRNDHCHPPDGAFASVGLSRPRGSRAGCVSKSSTVL
jgi:hypothetical protein